MKITSKVAGEVWSEEEKVGCMCSAGTLELFFFLSGELQEHLRYPLAICKYHELEADQTGVR